MTALSQYSRLETLGRWTPSQGESSREVVVAFGDATIVLSDGSGQPLSHWSLPAVVRLNPGVTPALFTPDPEGTETLELAEGDWVIGAIEKIQSAVTGKTASPKRLRKIALGLTLAILAAAIGFGPTALRQSAANLAPFSKSAEIGTTLLGQLQVQNAQSCRDIFGLQALGTLRQRLFGPDFRGQIVVMPEGITGVHVLPGDTILVAKDTLRAAQEPAVVAGAILAAHTAAQFEDPLAALLKRLPLPATISLLTKGDIPFENLQAHVAKTEVHAPALAPEEALVARFQAAKVPLTPWAEASGHTGLSARDPFAKDAPPEVLSDNDWVALLGICA